MELLASPEAWIAFATLTALELVLGIDNIIFIAILVDKLPRAQQDLARRLGLFSGTMSVVGGIIGSGIFLNPAIVAQRTGSAEEDKVEDVVGEQAIAQHEEAAEGFLKPVIAAQDKLLVPLRAAALFQGRLQAATETCRRRAAA